MPPTNFHDLLLPIQDLFHQPEENFFSMSLEKIVKALKEVLEKITEKDPNLSRLDSVLIPLEKLRR